MKLREGDQPLPITTNSLCVQDEVVVDLEKRKAANEPVDEVVKDIEQRKAVGIERYGSVLHPNNGRSALRDAYEESVDQTMYLKQLLLEEQHNETQYSIAAWRQETFGDADTLALAARVNMEMTEFNYATGYDHDTELCCYTEPVETLMDEAADVIITLAGLATHLGYDLQAEVNKKMAINRQRKWKVAPGGIGFHTHE